MSQNEPTTTIKMMYSGNLEYISRTVDVKYEDILESAIERFSIPAEFKDFIQITNESNQIFNKDAFEYFILLFPNPEIIFYIRVDYSGLLRNLRSEKRKPFSKLNNKRKIRDEDGEVVGVPLTRQNCFIGSYPGLELSEPEEPKAEKPKTDFVKREKATIGRRSSRRAIRI